MLEASLTEQNREEGKQKDRSQESEILKGQCHEIFDPRFFSSNNNPLGEYIREFEFIFEK
jgi:hypothetical protein